MLRQRSVRRAAVPGVEQQSWGVAQRSWGDRRRFPALSGGTLHAAERPQSGRKAQLASVYGR